MNELIDPFDLHFNDLSIDPMGDCTELPNGLFVPTGFAIREYSFYGKQYSQANQEFGGLPWEITKDVGLPIAAGLALIGGGFGIAHLFDGVVGTAYAQASDSGRIDLDFSNGLNTVNSDILAQVQSARLGVTTDTCQDPPNRIYPTKVCFPLDGVNWLLGITLGGGIPPNPTNMAVNTVETWNLNNMTLTGFIQPPDATLTPTRTAIATSTSTKAPVSGSLSRGDANGDGAVTIIDFSILRANFGLDISPSTPTVTPTVTLTPDCPTSVNGNFYRVKACFTDSFGTRRLFGVNFAGDGTANHAIYNWDVDHNTFTNQIKVNATLNPDSDGIAIVGIVVDTALGNTYLLEAADRPPFTNITMARSEYFNTSHAIINPTDLASHSADNSGLPQGGINGVPDGFTLTEKSDANGKYLEANIVNSINAAENGRYNARLNSPVPTSWVKVS